MIHRVDRKIAIKVIETFSKMQKMLINCENILDRVSWSVNATKIDLNLINIDKCKIQRGDTEILYPFGCLKNTFSEIQKSQNE